MRATLHALLTLALLLPTASLADTEPQADDEAAHCAPLDRARSAAPVYVILYGYPHLPDEPDRTLHRVDEDLVLMHDFFAALDPRRTWVHGEPEVTLVERFDALRDPSWRALRATVDELLAELGPNQPDAQVYLYFSGHGVKARHGDGTGAQLFGRPESTSADRGFNGRIDGGLIADEILRPLSKHADVHLIVDTCTSYFLLSARDARSPWQTQRVRKAPPQHHLEAPFSEILPRVGATLAAHHSTYESTEVNGIFSHAVRTAALGIADLDRDGVLTYDELRYALTWLLANTPHAARPTIVPPGLHRSAPFIDWRSSPAARVCLPRSLNGPHIIATPHGPAASLPLHPQRPNVIWLRPGTRYELIGKERQLTFLAHDGALTAERDERVDRRGRAFRPRFTEPIDITHTDALPLFPAFDPEWYVGGGFSGAVGDLVTGGFGKQWSPTALAHIRLGHGRHRLALEGGWSWRQIREKVPTRGADRERRASAHTALAFAGYDLLTWEGENEASIAALIGGSRREGSGELTPEGAVRGSIYMPLPALPTLSVRVDARVALIPTATSLEAMLQLGLGVDFEVGIE